MPTQLSLALFEHEQKLITDFSKALVEEECNLKQKSRIKWLQLGDDGNNKFFYNACKSRWNCNKKNSLKNSDDIEKTSHKDMADIAINFYKDLLGSNTQVHNITSDLLLPSISDSQAMLLSSPFTLGDVLNSFKSMDKNRSPGPDGFTVDFFLATWDIVGTDVTSAILHFFNTLYMPRMIKSAAICLVSKTPNPSEMANFRPISCCNMVYKGISKMLTKRLKTLLLSIISQYQSAFIPNRSIGDNVLLAQVIFKDYHLASGQPRCTTKLDIHKAFDSLSWSFIFSAMERMKFPARFIDWVKSCVTACLFSIKINGYLEGYFQGVSGLRQGDPISPYLFVLAMEVLSACLKSKVSSGFVLSIEYD